MHSLLSAACSQTRRASACRVIGSRSRESSAAFFRLEMLGEWLMRWLNTPAQRGIIFGIAVGALAMSLRIWLSLERGTFFSEQS